jgi:hypothetical protein
MEVNAPEPKNIYQIKVKETLEPSISNWFGGVAIYPLENGETMLVGSFSDQPALRGFLTQLWNLNLTVISVTRIENKNS